MHVCVVGAGAIGSFIGAQIHSANHEDGVRVTLIGRKTLSVALEESSGRLVAVPLHGEASHAQVGENGLEVSNEIAAAADAQVIIIAVKSAQTKEVAQQVEQLPAGKTIVSLQNGVNNPHAIREVVGSKHRVLAGVVEFNVVWEQHTTFIQKSSGIVMVEDDDSDMGRRFVGLFTKSAIQTKLEKEIAAFQYGKLVINLTNAINALSGQTLIETFNDPGHRQVLAKSMNEAIHVFKNAGIKIKTTKGNVQLFPYLLQLPNCLFKILQPIFIKIEPGTKLSMLQDLESKRNTEINDINGEVVRIAQHNKIDIKVNKHIVSLINTAQNAFQGSPMIDGHTLLEHCNK